MAYRLLNNGYELSVGQKSHRTDAQALGDFADLSLSKTFNDQKLVFEVRLVVAENLHPASANTLLQQARNNYQVIIYDGHSGYSQANDNTFYTPTSYKNGGYQIFVLNGCSSFSYAYKILNTKALDFDDPLYMSIDVVSTFTSSNGHTFLSQIIKRIIGTNDFDNIHVLFKSKISRLSSLITGYSSISSMKTPHGAVISIKIQEAKTYKGKRIALGSRFKIFEDGGLHSVTYQDAVDQPFLDGSIKLKARDPIKFDRKGRLIAGCVHEMWNYSGLNEKYLKTLPKSVNGQKALPHISCFEYDPLLESYARLKIGTTHEVVIGPQSIALNHFEMKGDQVVGFLTKEANFYGQLWSVNSKVRVEYPKNHLIAIKTIEPHMVKSNGCVFDAGLGIKFIDFEEKNDQKIHSIRVQKGQLAEDCKTKSGYEIPIDAVINYDYNGWMVSLSSSKQDIKYNNEKFSGVVEFYPDPVDREIIAVIEPNFSRADSNLFPLTFHSNGRKKMALAMSHFPVADDRDQVSNLVISSLVDKLGLSKESFLLKGGLIFFDPNGKLAGGILKENFIWQDNTIPIGSVVAFNDIQPIFIMMGHDGLIQMIMRQLPQPPGPENQTPQQQRTDHVMSDYDLFLFNKEYLVTAGQQASGPPSERDLVGDFERFIEATDNLFENIGELRSFDLPQISFMEFEVSVGTLFYFNNNSYEVIPVVPQRYQGMVFCQFFPIIFRNDKLSEATLRYPVEFEEVELPAFTTVAFESSEQAFYYGTRKISYLYFPAGAVPPLYQINKGEYDKSSLIPSFRNTTASTADILTQDQKFMMQMLKRISWSN